MTTGADQRRLARHGTCRVPPVNIQDKFSRSIIDHFKDPEILKCRVRKRIQSVAHMGGLQCDDMQRLVDALSEELRDAIVCREWTVCGELSCWANDSCHKANQSI